MYEFSSIICPCDISSPPNEEASSSDHDKTSDEPEGDGESQDEVGGQVQQTFQLICKMVAQRLFSQINASIYRVKHLVS